MDVVRLRTPNPPAGNRKFAGFDCVRAVAALGVVLLHSCVPYLQHPMPGLAWPVRDSESRVVDCLFWSIEVFIMPLFLVLAGFLAWQTLTRRGSGALIKSRARRLFVPLLFGILVVLPLDLYCWLLGWVAEGLIQPVKLKSLKFDGGMDRDLWGLSHLWFLQYLFLYVLVLALVWLARGRFAIASRWKPTPGTATLAVLLAGSLVLYFRPEVVWGFQHSFFPVPSKWFYSGLFFAFGAMLAAWDGQLSWLTSNSRRLVAPAVSLLVAAVVAGRWQLGGGENHLAATTVAVLTCSSALLVAVTLIGLAAERISCVPSVVSYLAAASFWVYLVHHPIIGLVHLDLKWLFPSASPILKTAASFTIAGGVCLLTYEGLVRSTALGRMLGLGWELPAGRQPDGEVISIDSGRGPEPAVDEPSRRAA